MNTFLASFLLLAILALLYYIFFGKKRKAEPAPLMPGNFRQLLIEHVDFYSNLTEDKKLSFENRMQHFLAHTRITGVNTTVEDIDSVLIAASAIIPIFGFPDWEYINLNEVLLYPGSFNETFDQEGDDRHTLGLVGTGPYQNIMILSKNELREGAALPGLKARSMKMRLFRQ